MRGVEREFKQVILRPVPLPLDAYQPTDKRFMVFRKHVGSVELDNVGLICLISKFILPKLE